MKLLCQIISTLRVISFFVFPAHVDQAGSPDSVYQHMLQDNIRVFIIAVSFRRRSEYISHKAKSYVEDARDKFDEANRLFLASLGGGLGDLATAGRSLLDRLDDTDSDSLAHVTDGETTQRRVVGESLNAHGLGRSHLDDGRVTGLDELGVVLNRLTSTAVDLLKNLGELASNVGSVAVENGGVARANLTRVVQDNDLGVEGSGAGGGVVLGVRSDVTTADILDGDVLHVETNVVTGETLGELLVVHLDGLDFSGDVGGSEGDDHTGLDDTSLDTADRHRSNTTDLVDILEGKTEGLVERTLGGLDGVNGLEDSLASDLGTTLTLLLPALVPGAVGGRLQHVVTVETRDGDEGNSLGVVADLLDEVGSLLDNLKVTGLLPLSSVHLVDGDNELSDTESVGEESVLTSLAILGDTSLELTSTGSDNENSAVGLGSTSNHVLDEITVTGSINDSDMVLGSLELPESDINGDTTLTLGLELVKNPGILERTLAKFGGFLLKLLNGTLVDTTALVDQVTSGGGLAGIDVADNDDVDVSLLVLTHFGGVLVVKFGWFVWRFESCADKITRI
jgi:hypothetical protein